MLRIMHYDNIQKGTLKLLQNAFWVAKNQQKIVKYMQRCYG